jgi:hypothetical protein
VKIEVVDCPSAQESRNRRTRMIKMNLHGAHIVAQRFLRL